MKEITEKEVEQLLGYTNQFKQHDGSYMGYSERFLAVATILLERINKKLDILIKQKGEK